MNSRSWVRIYIAIYVVLIAGIVLLVARGCPEVFRSSRFDVRLSIGCGIGGGHGVSLGVHMASWLVFAGAVAAVGLLISLAFKRQPTRASVVVWFSAGIAEWSYGLFPRSWVEFRDWILPADTLLGATLVLMGLTMIMAIAAGLSLSVPREQAQVTQLEPVYPPTHSRH